MADGNDAKTTPTAPRGCLSRALVLVLVIFSAGLGVAVYFMAQPQDLSDVRSDSPVSSPALPLDVKALLQNALDHSYPVKFTQSEINRWLTSTLQTKQGGKFAGHVSLDAVWVRLEDGRIDLAAAVDKRLLAQAGSPAAAAGAIMNQGCGPGDRRVPSAASLAAATFRATPALTHAASLVVGEAGRIFRVGDAAGYVEPFTGEGIGWALASARVLAAAASAPEHAATLATAEIASRYGNLHLRLLGAHHARCRRVAWAVRRPGLVGGALRLAQCFPWAAGHVVPGLIGAGWSAAGAQPALLAEATHG